MNQYATLSTTTVFLVASSTMHYNNQRGVLTSISKTFLNITVSSDRHWDGACTTLAIRTLFLLGDSDCSIRRRGFLGTVSNPHSKQPSIHKQHAHDCSPVARRVLSSPQSRHGPGTARRATVAARGASPQPDSMSAPLLRTTEKKKNQTAINISSIIPFLPAYGKCHGFCKL